MSVREDLLNWRWQGVADDGLLPPDYESARAGEFQLRLAIVAITISVTATFTLVLSMLVPAIDAVMTRIEILLVMLIMAAVVVASRASLRLRQMQFFALVLSAMPLLLLERNGALDVPHTLIAIFMTGLLFPWSAGEAFMAALIPLAGFVFTQFSAGRPLAGNDSASIGVSVMIVTIAQFLWERARRRVYDHASRAHRVQSELVANDEMAAVIHRELISGDQDRTGLAVRVRYEPMLKLGGDYVKIREIAPGRTSMLIADVTGHGVPAALMVNRINAEVERLLSRALGPARAARELNAFVNQQFAGSGMLMTAIWVEYDARRRLMRWVNYGHPPPIRIDPVLHIVRPLKGGVPPMGMGMELEKEEQTITLDPGQWVMFHTDGLTPGAFDENRLMEFVEWHAHSIRSSEKMLKCVVEKAFLVQDFDLTDDLLVVLWEAVKSGGMEER